VPAWPNFETLLRMRENATNGALVDETTHHFDARVLSEDEVDNGLGAH
jgi:hypothetical protein